jgi:hypothetical protein
VSESPSDGQPETSGPSQSSNPPRSNSGPSYGNNSSNKSYGNNSSNNKSNSGQTRANGQPGSRSQSGSGRGASRGSDPVADFQRWLMKAGARSMANQVADQVKRTLGTEQRDSGDVWDTATNEPPPSEPPECQWCPVCQAARAARTGSAGGLGASLANAGGVLASVVQDAFSAFEQVMKTQDQNHPAGRPGVSPPRTGASDRGETGQ